MHIFGDFFPGYGWQHEKFAQCCNSVQSFKYIYQWICNNINLSVELINGAVWWNPLTRKSQETVPLTRLIFNFALPHLYHIMCCISFRCYIKCSTYSRFLGPCIHKRHGSKKNNHVDLEVPHTTLVLDGITRVRDSRDGVSLTC